MNNIEINNGSNYHKELETLRLEINQADENIIRALAERVDVIKKVGILKKAHGVKPLDKSRWQLVLQKITILAKQHDLNPKPIRAMYEIMHNYALELES